jgi:uncharacterized protein (DUF952 family)
VILHIVPENEYDEDAEYRPKSLETEGFVHCSDFGTVHLPANRLFAGRTDLIVVVIDPNELNCRVRWEEGDPPHPDGILFPHVYGPIPPHAVFGWYYFRPTEDGFKLPKALAGTIKPHVR